MKFEIQRDQCNARVMITESLYSDDAVLLQKRLVALIEDGITSLTIDFSALGSMGYIDSAGLGALISIRKCSLRNGGGMTITGLEGMVEDLFRLARLDRLFNLKTSDGASMSADYEKRLIRPGKSVRREEGCE